jgi:hypothetical protein
MAFCTKCGHKNDAAGRFCEDCGAPLKSSPSAQQNTSQPTAASAAPVPPAAVGNAAASSVNPSVLGKKIAKYVGIGVLVLAIAGGIAAFALRDESPSNALFASIIEKSLATDSGAYKQRYCLHNFAYDKDPVSVNSYDAGTQRWMAVLTKAGLYSEPETVSQSTGFFVTQQLRYQKTDAGKKATSGSLLCIADGVSVKSVDAFTPATKVGDIQVSKATVTLQLKTPMPWVTEDDAKQAGVDVQTEFQDTKVLVLKERKWVLASDADIRSAQAGMYAQKQNQFSSTSNGPGLFASLMKIFGGKSNPLIGHWTSNVMGFAVVAFDFDANSMTTNGSKVKVRYEVTDNDVTVYPLQNSDAGMVFKVIDANTMSVNMGMAALQITRTQ